MDLRKTLGLNERFADLLTTSFQEKKVVALLLDDQGLERAGGYIKLIDTDSPVPFLELEGGKKIDLHTIVAVDGVFAEAYSGC